MTAYASLDSQTLERLLSEVQDGIFALDRNKTVVFCNEACERITGQPASQIVGHKVGANEAPQPAQREESFSSFVLPDTILDGSQDSARQKLEIAKPDGSHTWVESIYTTVRDRNGDVELVFGVMRDLSHAKPRPGEVYEDAASLRETIKRLTDESQARYGISTLISRSPAMEPVMQRARAAAQNASSVLISGEAGCGKETLARAIHNAGIHAKGPFVVVSCSALSRDQLDAELFGATDLSGASTRTGRAFEAAQGGTLFIEDLTDMPSDTQARLLRVLQEKPAAENGNGKPCPRIAAAISYSLQEALTHHKLRKDLLYRLGVIQIEMPPLRKRAEDIPVLVQSVIDRLNQTHTRQIAMISPDAWRALSNYAWTGNIRELEAAIESAFALGQGPVLQKSDLPPEVQGIRPPMQTPARTDALRLDNHLEQVERDAILRALVAAGGQRNRAAELMGISRSRLYRRMEALGIDPNARM